MTRKIIVWLLVIIIIGAISSYFFLRYLTYTPHSAHMTLQAPHGHVVIDWDEHGVPHITAQQDDNDAVFALGYVHAMDRSWQMDIQRHIVAGRLSEIFGTHTIEADKFLRTWGLYRAATTIWPVLDNKTQAAVASYTAGVNAYLQHGKRPLQLLLLDHHIEPWTNTDSLSWSKMMAWYLQRTWQDKVNNYLVAQHYGKEQIDMVYPQYPHGAPTVIPPNKQSYKIKNKFKLSNQPKVNRQFNKSLVQLLHQAQVIYQQLGYSDAPSKGSNNWVVSGKLTASGKPLLANDLHLGLQAPALWYLAELTGPTLHVTGATLPGLPMVIIGHNDRIAWGMTTSYIDAQDLYIEKEEALIKSIDEEIKIKGQAPIHYTVRYSRHGPIISDITAAKGIGPHVALRWPALLPGDTTAMSFYQLNYANNWHDFRQALRHFVTPSQNMIYADVDGNIGVYVPGKIPLRRDHDGSLPIQPNEHHEWQGFIPFAELPHAYNPPQGYIASANNKIIDEHYPYRLTFRWKVPPYRINRIIDLLKANTPLTIAKMKKMQGDTISYLWLDLKPLLLKAHPLDKDSKQALALLNNWDGDMSRDSVAATIFAFWYHELSRLLPITNTTDHNMAPALYEPLFFRQQLKEDGRYCRLAHYGNCQDFLDHSLQHTMQQLIKTQGRHKDNWRWGKIHYADFVDLGLGKVKPFSWLFNRSISTPGGNFTVNVGIYRKTNFRQHVGASYRQIIDLGSPAKSIYMQTLGQSDNIFSPHYDDLLKLWRDEGYLLMGKSTHNRSTSMVSGIKRGNK